MAMIALLALLHLYVGLRLVPSLPGWGAALLLLWLAASLLLIPLAFHNRRRAGAERLHHAGMLALGAFSPLIVLTVVRDVAALAAAAAGLALPAWSAAAVPLAAAAFTLAGFVAARRTARVRTVDVPLAGLPRALHGFTIAQLSDVHVGPTIKRPYVQAIVDRVNALDADAVAITGDLVDGRVADLAGDVAPLAGLRSRHGTYFVTGNHEYYSGATAWIGELRRLGIAVLLNEHVVLQHGDASLVLAGVTDHGAGHFDRFHTSDAMRAIAGAPADAAARVLLAHQPRSAPGAADAGFDLQLSGHTHGGQIWPWNLLVPLQQPFTAGLHRLRQLWVYTSRGTGYWGPPLRFLAPSEITRVRLVAA